MNGELIVVDDLPGAFASQVIASYENRPEELFAMALSGGDTARQCYERLAQDGSDAIDWLSVNIYWGDERCVPPDDPDSNQLLGRQSLLERVGAANAVYPMNCQDGPDAYQLRLGEVGKLDLIHLGLGPDGHTASLFPDQSTLGERSRPVVGVPEAGLEPFVPRVSLTLPALSQTRQMVFLIAGEGKAEMVARAFGPDAQPDPHVPASLLPPLVDELQVLIDPDAARQLPAEG